LSNGDGKTFTEAQSKARRPSVLVIDDDAQILSLLARIISGWGYRVETAQAGEEGLAKFQQKPFDVVLTDYQMKGIDGIEVTARIKAEYPQAEVLMMTGHEALGPSIQAMKKGAFNFIQKPLDFDYLKLLLDRATERLRSLLLEEEQMKSMTLLEFHRKMLNPLEKKYLEVMLRANRGDISETAGKMDIPPSILSEKIKEHGLNIEDFKSP
jgi:DNA-binding NtrC family response regulator